MNIGVRAEDKNEWETRTPLVPEDIRQLKAQGISILVQSSHQRIFSDEEFDRSGIGLRDDLNACRIIFGLKEIPIEKLETDRIYFIFSHVAKGQTYNMPMLSRMMELGVTLVDYEMIADDRGRRLIFFGRHAGIAGMINSLWALGQRFALEKCSNPLTRIQQARHYQDLEEVRQAIGSVAEDISKHGLPKAMHPLVVGFVGYGNVSTGAQEIFNLLPYKDLRPHQLSSLSGRPDLDHKVAYKVVFKEEHCVTPRKPDQSFDLQDYYQHGSKKYRSMFTGYLDHLSLLVNGNYWDERYPRILTLDTCRDMWGGGRQPKLRVIGDISCDINGSIECTVKPAYPDRPVYVYHPDTGKVTDGFAGHGPVIMAVEILPAEIPRESSTHFSSILKHYVTQIHAADWDGEFDELHLPAEIKKAVILYQGKLTPDYRYLQNHL